MNIITDHTNNVMSQRNNLGQNKIGIKFNKGYFFCDIQSMLKEKTI